MKKSEIYKILEGIELTDASRLEIDKLLGLVQDNEDVPAEKISAVMDIIKLEISLEDVNMQALDEAIGIMDKASTNLDDLEKSTITEFTAKAEQQVREEKVVDDEMQYLEDLANKANNTPVQTPAPVQPQVGI